MKPGPLLLCLALPFASAVFAADTVTDLERFARDQPPAPPVVDAKRIVNASNSFLKEREPEMTTEEYALHEKVVTMLTTNPELALKLLEAMMNEKEPPSPAFEFILGNAYSAAGQPDRAEKSYRGALTRYPAFLRAWSNLGLLHYTRNRYADAIECFANVAYSGS